MSGNFVYHNANLISSLEISLIVITLLLQLPDAPIISLCKRFKIVTFASILFGITLISAFFDFRLSHGLALSLIGAYVGIFLGQHLLSLIKQNQGLFTLIGLWVISTTISYYFSPFAEKQIMWVRYQQTFTHILTFLALWNYFHQHPRQDSPIIFSALSISALIIALSTLAIYLTQADVIKPYQWFFQPPFNSHIRHAGYFFTAALAVTLCVFSLRIKSRIYFLCLNIILIILWAYLLWAGGRTATASVILTAVFIWLVLLRSNERAGRFLIVSVITFLVGLFVSEWLSVFPWNGMVDGITRTANAENINRISSGRIAIWTYSLEAIKNNLWFGLGANGYFSIPDRLPLTAQPHSMLVQFLVEWGIVGTSLFLTILLLTVKRGYSLMKPAANASGSTQLAPLMACSLILALSLHGLTDGSYFYAQPSFLLSIMFAIIWSTPLNSQKEAPKISPGPTSPA